MTKEATPPLPDGLVEELRRLITDATDENLTDGGRYFQETCDDLTKCSHGDTGEYQHGPDGELVEWLWNNRKVILTALTPPAPVAEEGLEQHLCGHCGAQYLLMGAHYIERISEALDAAGAPRKSPDGNTHYSITGRIAALSSPQQDQGLVKRVADAIQKAARDAVGKNVGEPYYLHIARAAIAAGAVQQEGAYRAMREALEPFAKVGGFMCHTPRERSVDLIYNAVEADGLNSRGSARLRVADFKRARQALAQSDLTPGSGEGA